MAWSKRKIALVCLAPAAAAGCALTGGLAAPLVGAWVGATFLGLSGAAATSAGLALLGGGSVAAGGLGVAGGTAVIAASGGAIGGVIVGAVAKKLGEGLTEGKDCNCGHINPLEAKFCLNCGKRFGNGNA